MIKTLLVIRTGSATRASNHCRQIYEWAHGYPLSGYKNRSLGWYLCLWQSRLGNIYYASRPFHFLYVGDNLPRARRTTPPLTPEGDGRFIHNRVRRRPPSGPRFASREKITLHLLLTHSLLPSASRWARMCGAPAPSDGNRQKTVRATLPKSASRRVGETTRVTCSNYPSSCGDIEVPRLMRGTLAIGDFRKLAGSDIVASFAPPPAPIQPVALRHRRLARAPTHARTWNLFLIWYDRSEKQKTVSPALCSERNGDRPSGFFVICVFFCVWYNFSREIPTYWAYDVPNCTKWVIAVCHWIMGPADTFCGWIGGVGSRVSHLTLAALCLMFHLNIFNSTMHFSVATTWIRNGGVCWSWIGGIGLYCLVFDNTRWLWHDCITVLWSECRWINRAVIKLALGM